MSADNANCTAAGISRHDVQNTLYVYNELIKTSGKYYRKILELSQAASEFANMLEALGKCKGAEQSGVGLTTAAELHRLMAKNQEQLSEAILKDFELPLQRNLIAHSKRVEENEKTYEKVVRRIQEEISKTEGKMLKGRKKDMNAFQQSLQDMQKQAQELETTKQENFDRVLADEQKNFMFLVQKAAGVVKSEFDHFNTMAALSREATEEIISIAFAPPGKVLDSAEKRRVVDKFLGGAASNHATHSVDNGGSEISRTGTFSMSEDVPRSSQGSFASTAIGTAITVQKSSESPASQASSNFVINTRPASPTPNLSGGNPRLSSASSAAIALQESLQRLNVGMAVSSHTQAVQDDKENTSIAENAFEKPERIEKSPSFSQQRPELDLVLAIHDFNARTERELSFKKMDLLLVKQRQENWLYATHYTETSGSPHLPSKSGWIPVSYVSKHQK